MFDDSLINEIIASNSENISTYKLNMENFVKPEKRTNNIYPSTYQPKNNYKASVYIIINNNIIIIILIIIINIFIIIIIILIIINFLLMETIIH